jgi:LacI family transcriptional regulator
MARKNRPIRVALLVTVRYHPFEEQIVRGVLRYNDHAGPWRFATHHGIPFIPLDVVLDVTNLAELDGVIGPFHYHDPIVQLLEQAGVKAVNTSTGHEKSTVPRVASDDVAIGRLGADHVLERGFPQYGFLMQANAWFSHRQFEGFRQVVEGQARRPCHLINDWVEGPVRRPENLAQAFQRLPKPIAVMCATDLLAQRLVDAAVAVGLRVPEEVAVLGVDNHVWLSAIAATPLSSVELDGERIGYRAAQTLDAMMAGEQPPPAQWIPPIGVVTRHSTDTTFVDDPLVVEALRFIADHCHEAIGVEDVLEAVGVSRTALEVRLKRATGKTPQVAIFGAQIHRAKKMLVDSDTSVGQIAYQCGFDRQERLNVIFKRLTGMTPGQYRQQRSR